MSIDFDYPLFPPATFLVLLSIFVAMVSDPCLAQIGLQWKIHDTRRPNPPIIDPGTLSTQEQPGKPPSDAIVLFDGKDLSQWRAMDGGPTKWVVKNGYMECVKGSGYIRTLQNFGDCQLHIEWAAPLPVEGTGQGRGNSGVFLMGKYEVQVLDSYNNVTYADGQAAAIYGQYPPLVNACRAPGQWQSYDIIFHGPRFDNAGKLLRPARMTVLHNGVLVQDNAEILGPTMWMNRLPYEQHPEKLPLSLQDHGNPVRYRNIWLRELVHPEQPVKAQEKEITLPETVLDKYVGQYEVNPTFTITITNEGGQLMAHLYGQAKYALYAESEKKFFFKVVDAQITFNVNDKGVVESLTMYQGGGEMLGKKIN